VAPNLQRQVARDERNVDEGVPWGAGQRMDIGGRNEDGAALMRERCDEYSAGDRQSRSGSAPAVGGLDADGDFDSIYITRSASVGTNSCIDLALYSQI
jgi:hypothetical protein